MTEQESPLNRWFGRPTDGNWMGWPGHLLAGFGFGLSAPNFHDTAIHDLPLETPDFLYVVIGLAALVLGEAISLRMVDSYIRRMDLISIAAGGLAAFLMAVGGGAVTLWRAPEAPNLALIVYLTLWTWVIARWGVFMALWSRDQNR